MASTVTLRFSTDLKTVVPMDGTRSPFGQSIENTVKGPLSTWNRYSLMVLNCNPMDLYPWIRTSEVHIGHNGSTTTRNISVVSTFGARYHWVPGISRFVYFPCWCYYTLTWYAKAESSTQGLVHDENQTWNIWSSMGFHAIHLYNCIWRCTVYCGKPGWRRFG